MPARGAMFRLSLGNTQGDRRGSRRPAQDAGGVTVPRDDRRRA
jgi:hypothetical protein